MKTSHIKNPFIRVTAYIFISLLCFAIGYTFLSSGVRTPKNDPNMAALVNGEQISKLDVFRQRDLRNGMRRVDNFGDKEFKQLLDEIVRLKLYSQYARKQGIAVSDELVAEIIQRFLQQFFGGRSDRNLLRDFLENYKQFSADTLFAIMKDNGLAGEVQRMFYYGVGISPEELEFQAAVNKGTFQIKYAFISNEEFRKKFGSAVAVSDKEIDEEMSRNKGEIKDPATDRESFRKRILDRKLADTKKTIITAVNEAANKGEGFDKAVSILNAPVWTTEQFKAGEQIKEQGQAGKPLYLLGESEIFRKDFASLKPGVTSRAIESRDGIYIFTPTKKDIKAVPAGDKAVEAMTQELSYMKMNYIRISLLNSFFEKAEIERGAGENPGSDQ